MSDIVETLVLARQFTVAAENFRALATATDSEPMAEVAKAFYIIGQLYMRRAEATARRDVMTRLIARISALLIVIVVAGYAFSVASAQSAVATATEDTSRTFVVQIQPEGTETPVVEPTLTATVPVEATQPPILTTQPAPEDGSGTPPTGIEVPGIGETGSAFLAVLVGLLGGTVGAPSTLFIVSLLKRIRALDPVPANTLALIVSVVIVIVVWIARYFGVEAQINSLLSAIQIAGPVILTFILSLIGSGALYSSAVKNNTAIVGYARPAGAAQSVPPKH